MKSNNDRLISQGREDKKIPERRALFDTDNSSGVEIASGVVSTPTKSQSAVKSFTVTSPLSSYFVSKPVASTSTSDVTGSRNSQNGPSPGHRHSDVAKG